MNVIMSSPNQKSNAPSFIGIAQNLKKEDKKTQETITAANKGYNNELVTYLYLVDFYKKLESVENGVMEVYRHYCDSTYTLPILKAAFNSVLILMDKPAYITVTPVPE